MYNYRRKVIYIEIATPGPSTTWRVGASHKIYFLTTKLPPSYIKFE